MHQLDKRQLNIILKEKYGLSDFTIKSLRKWEDRLVFKISTAKIDYVLRCFLNGRGRDKIKRDISILTFLGKHNFPAPRLVPTKSGGASVDIGAFICFLTLYYEGQSLKLNNFTMRQMGELTARLHLLGENKLYSNKASWNIVKTRKFFLQQVQKTKYHKLKYWNDVIPNATQAFKTLPNMESLPQSIIHTDIHPGNIIQTNNSGLIITDWDDAGVGPAILDVGYILVHQCITFARKNSFKPIIHNDFAKSFLDAYEKLRPLTKQELKNLTYAMRFGALAYVFHWWVPVVAMINWIRYQSIDKIRIIR